MYHNKAYIYKKHKNIFSINTACKVQKNRSSLPLSPFVEVVAFNLFKPYNFIGSLNAILLICLFNHCKYIFILQNKY